MSVTDKVAAGRRFSPGTQISSTNKTDRHYKAEILLIVALNTISHKPVFYMFFFHLIKLVNLLSTY
jgi:hypothetical protein